MCVTKQLLVPIDVHSMEKKYYEVNGDQKLFGCQHNIIYSCIQLNKFTQVWNNLRHSEYIRLPKMSELQGFQRTHLLTKHV